MNHTTCRHQIEKQMLLYIDFLPHCETIAQKLKLLDEINLQRAMIAEIDQADTTQEEIINF